MPVTVTYEGCDCCGGVCCDCDPSTLPADLLLRMSWACIDTQFDTASGCLVYLDCLKGATDPAEYTISLFGPFDPDPVFHPGEILRYEWRFELDCPTDDPDFFNVLGLTFTVDVYASGVGPTGGPFHCYLAFWSGGFRGDPDVGITCFGSGDPCQLNRVSCSPLHLVWSFCSGIEIVEP